MFYRCWLSVWSHVLSFVYPKIKYTNIFWQTPGSNGESNETPANSYTSVKTLMENPCGHRIDYIFYQSSQAYKVRFAEETILYCNFCISVPNVVSIKKKISQTQEHTHMGICTLCEYTQVSTHSYDFVLYIYEQQSLTVFAWLMVLHITITVAVFTVSWIKELVNRRNRRGM